MKAQPTLIESFHRFHCNHWDTLLIVHDIKLGTLTFTCPEAKPQNARQAVYLAISATEQAESYLNAIPQHIIARNPKHHETKLAKAIFELQYLNDLLQLTDKILWTQAELIYK